VPGSGITVTPLAPSSIIKLVAGENTDSKRIHNTAGTLGNTGWPGQTNTSLMTQFARIPSMGPLHSGGATTPFGLARILLIWE
jgi:hypothetical protein